MKLCLVTDDPAVEAAVRLSVHAPDTVDAHALDGVTDARNVLSAHGRVVVEATEGCDAVLVSFALERAPVLNTLGYHVRRRQGPPVVALYLGGPEERVAALAAGADEALGFPLHVGVIQARALAHGRLVDAVKQHQAGRPAAPAPADVVAVGPLRLDRTSRRFSIRGEEVTLTPREFALLDYLLAHAGSVRTRDEILDAVWGLSFDTGTNMVDVYVYFLRRKLEGFGVRGLIETVRGRGYRLVRPEEAAVGAASEAA